MLFFCCFFFVLLITVSRSELLLSEGITTYIYSNDKAGENVDEEDAHRRPSKNRLAEARSDYSRLEYFYRVVSCG